MYRERRRWRGEGGLIGRTGERVTKIAGKYSPTRTLAAGLSTPMFFKIVAPSLVTCTPSLWGPLETSTLSWEGEGKGQQSCVIECICACVHPYHSLGSKGALDEVANSNGTDKGALAEREEKRASEIYLSKRIFPFLHPSPVWLSPLYPPLLQPGGSVPG